MNEYKRSFVRRQKGTPDVERNSNRMNFARLTHLYSAVDGSQGRSGGDSLLRKNWRGVSVLATSMPANACRTQLSKGKGRDSLTPALSSKVRRGPEQWSECLTREKRGFI